MNTSELDALTEALVLEDVTFLEFSCKRAEASTRWESFDEIPEGDAALEIKSERQDQRIYHTCRVRVKAPAAVLYRIEVQAAYAWKTEAPSGLTDEDLNEYCVKRGVLVLLPIAREALISAGARLRAPAPVLPIATSDGVEQIADLDSASADQDQLPND